MIQAKAQWHKASAMSPAIAPLWRGDGSLLRIDALGHFPNRHI
jgi:hypothetical protein